MKILGIETSCDETGAAVVELHEDGPGAILRSNVVLSSKALELIHTTVLQA